MFCLARVYQLAIAAILTSLLVSANFIKGGNLVLAQSSIPEVKGLLSREGCFNISESQNVDENILIEEICVHNPPFEACQDEMIANIDESATITCQEYQNALNDCLDSNGPNATATCVDEAQEFDNCTATTEQAYAYCACHSTTVTEISACANKLLNIASIVATTSESTFTTVTPSTWIASHRSTAISLSAINATLKTPMLATIATATAPAIPPSTVASSQDLASVTTVSRSAKERL